MMQWCKDNDRAKLKYLWLHITVSLLSVNCDSAFKLKTLGKYYHKDIISHCNFTKKDLLAIVYHIHVIFFIIAPCVLIFTQFIHQQMHVY